MEKLTLTLTNRYLSAAAIATGKETTRAVLKKVLIETCFIETVIPALKNQETGEIMKPEETIYHTETYIVATDGHILASFCEKDPIEGSQDFLKTLFSTVTRYESGNYEKIQFLLDLDRITIDKKSTLCNLTLEILKTEGSAIERHKITYESGGKTQVYETETESFPEWRQIVPEIPTGTITPKDSNGNDLEPEPVFTPVYAGFSAEITGRIQKIAEIATKNKDTFPIWYPFTELRACPIAIQDVPAYLVAMPYRRNVNDNMQKREIEILRGLNNYRKKLN